MRYRFVNRGGCFGPEEIENRWGELGIEMIARIGEDEGALTPRAFCEHWAAELGDPPETVWPEGFRPSERTGAVTDPGLDGDALSEGFRSAS